MKRPVYEIGRGPGGGWVVIEHIPDDEMESELENVESDGGSVEMNFRIRESVRIHGPFEMWKAAEDWIRRRHQELAVDMDPGELERDSARRAAVSSRLGLCVRDLGTAADAVRRVIGAMAFDSGLDLPGLSLARAALPQAHLQLEAAQLDFSNEADAARGKAR